MKRNKVEASSLEEQSIKTESLWAMNKRKKKKKPQKRKNTNVITNKKFNNPLKVVFRC